MIRPLKNKWLSKSALLFSIVLLTSALGFAQSTFIKKYTINPDDGDVFRSAIEVDGGYVFYNSTVVNVPFSRSQGGLVYTDYEGEIIWSTKWDFPDGRIGISFEDGLTCTADSILAIASYRSDSIFSNYGVVITERLSGNSRVIRHTDTVARIGDGIYQVNNGGFVFSGAPSIGRNGYFPFSISRLSNIDQEITYTEYLKDYYIVFSNCSTVNSDGEVFAAFQGCKMREGCNQLRGGLLKINEDDQVDWVKDYGGSAGNQDVNPQVAILNDTTIAYSWTRDTNNLDIQESPPVIYFLDTLGNKRDSLAIHGNWRTLITLRPTANGDLIGSGVAWTDIGWCGWMIRVSPEAELIWERYIQDHRDSPNARTDFTEVFEDGQGYIIGAGAISESQFPEDGSSSLKAWVVKLDANGCLDPGCTSDTIYLEDPVAVEEVLSPSSDFAELFPNPATDFINLSIKENPWLANGGEYQIISSSGRIFAQGVISGREQQIPIAELPNGLYFLKLEVDGRILASVRFVKAS